MKRTEVYDETRMNDRRVDCCKQEADVTGEDAFPRFLWLTRKLPTSRERQPEWRRH